MPLTPSRWADRSRSPRGGRAAPPAPSRPRRSGRARGAPLVRREGRAIATVALHDHAELPAAAGGGRPATLALADVRYVDGGMERYLLPLVVDRGEDGPSGAEFRMDDREHGRVVREPRAGEGIWAAIAGLLAHGGELGGVRGTFQFRPGSAGSPTARTYAAERRLTGEQSNTSVVIDEELFLKCYRRIDDGMNPEVEILEFLAERAFDRTPALVGSAVYEPEDGKPSGIAILQALVSDAADAWELTLDLARRWVSSDEAGDDRLRAEASATAIGMLTGRLHATLASAPSDPRFPVRLATHDERRGWHSSGIQQLEGALAALSGDPALVGGIEPLVRSALAPLGDSGKAATVIRTHGDYHLGQLLHRAGDFLVVDFEGEPARLLADRRGPHSPLKDVAGMLRSFDYAAGTVRHELEAAGDATGAVHGTQAVEAWRTLTRTRFLESYRSAVRRSGLPAEIDLDLLRAFEVEKACYEIRYEANNRPRLVWLPVEGLRALVTP